MENEKKENSVKSLMSLYTVVIGVALSLSIVTLIDPKEGLASVRLSPILLFISFIATLFPFYQGAYGHISDAYLEKKNSHIRDGALIIDFVLLFFHGIAFVVLALLLSKPSNFVWVLVILLTIDVIWGLFVYFGPSSASNHNAEGKWTFINFLFVLIVASYLIHNDIYLDDIPDPIKLSFPLMGVCLIRTIVDYIWCRGFYFPKLDKGD